MFANPLLTAVQLEPLLVERNTPPLSVPAKRFVPEMASAETEGLVKPLLTAIQLVPLLVERNTPPAVPTNRFASLTTRQL